MQELRGVLGVPGSQVGSVQESVVVLCRFLKIVDIPPRFLGYLSTNDVVARVPLKCSR